MGSLICVWWVVKRFPSVVVVWLGMHEEWLDMKHEYKMVNCCVLFELWERCFWVCFEDDDVCFEFHPLGKLLLRKMGCGLMYPDSLTSFRFTFTLQSLTALFLNLGLMLKMESHYVAADGRSMKLVGDGNEWHDSCMFLTEVWHGGVLQGYLLMLLGMMLMHEILLDVQLRLSYIHHGRNWVTFPQSRSLWTLDVYERVCVLR